MKQLIAAIVILSAGCAVKQPAPLTYRLMSQVLVPPGVPNATVGQASFVASVSVRSCGVSGPILLQTRGKRTRIAVGTEELVKEPGDWLSKWAVELEAKRCVAPGDGWKLARQVTESVPMDSRAAFRLLYGEAVDIGPQLRIQVDSPILRDEAGPILADSQVSASSGGLNVEVRASDNLVGYERDWYGMKDGSIVPMTAELHINGVPESRPRPLKNYLSFANGAAYYRLVYKQEQTEFTALVVAGRSAAELNANAVKLATKGANCGLVTIGYCVSIPRGVAANLFLPVTVNGEEKLVHWGGAVRDAVPSTAIPTLTISKLHNGKLTPVEFDRSGRDILSLPLVGGETITFTTPQ